MSLFRSTQVITRLNTSALSAFCETVAATSSWRRITKTWLQSEHHRTNPHKVPEALICIRLHQEFAERVPGQERDLAGGYIGPADTKEKHADVTPTDVEMDPTPEGEEPNEQERLSLRRVGENLPAPAYLIAIVELTERFT